MEYQIKHTEMFAGWLAGLKDTVAKAAIIRRLRTIELTGNLGDNKSLGSGLYELRFFYGQGYRIYFTVKQDRILILISGGNKSPQFRDTDKARKLIEVV